MKEKSYKTEFHVHTKFSHDSGMGKLALFLMCKVRGINSVAITDHNEINGALAYKPWLETKGISVIVGEEIFTSEGEIIGLFLKSKIEPELSPEETIRQIHLQDGIVYIPHPFDEKRKKTVISSSALERCASLIDCAEIHNGRNVKALYSKKQSEITASLNLLPIVGSDAHCFLELGRNYCISDKPFDAENFSTILKESVLFSSKCLLITHQITKLVRLKKMLLNRDFDGIRRVLIRKFKN